MYRCSVCGKSSPGPYCGVCGGKCFLKENKEIKSRKKTRILRDILITFTISITIIIGGLFVYKTYTENLKNEVSKAVEIAEETYKKMEYSVALSQLNDVKENKYYDENEKALRLEGKIHMELKDYEKAAECFEKSLDIKHDDDTVLNLAVSYARAGRSEKALNSMKKINDKKDAKAYIEGEIYCNKDDFILAEESFRKVIKITNDEGIKRNAYISLANMYKERRHDEKEGFPYLNKQIEILEEAVRELKAEDDIVITEMMGEAYFTAKNYDLSLIKFNRLLELGYERAYIYRNIAIIHQQTGNYKEAEKVLLEMRGKYPEDYTCYEQLAYLYLHKEGEKPQNERDYSKVEENYNLAKKYVDSKNKSELIPLENAIKELEEKGWL